MAREAKYERKRGRWAGPKLLDEVGIVSHDSSEHEGHQDCVVELSRHRNEVRDEVEWHREIRDQRRYQQLVSPRQPRLAQEPPKQNDAVGEEPNEGARIRPPSSHEAPVSDP